MYMSVVFPRYGYGQMNSYGEEGRNKRKKERKVLCDEFEV